MIPSGLKNLRACECRSHYAPTPTDIIANVISYFYLGIEYQPGTGYITYTPFHIRAYGPQLLSDAAYPTLLSQIPLPITSFKAMYIFAILLSCCCLVKQFMVDQLLSSKFSNAYYIALFLLSFHSFHSFIVLEVSTNYWSPIKCIVKIIPNLINSAVCVYFSPSFIDKFKTSFE